MATLNDILNIDLGLGDEVEKTASENKQLSEIEKLAATLGLTTESSENQDTFQDNIGLNKEAQMSLDTIYADMFPGDADIVGQDKFASQEDEGMDKEAAALEEAIGERAFDYFSHYVDAHVEKIASEIAHVGELEDHGPAKLEDNEDESGAPMNTKGDMHVGDKAMSVNPTAPVGEFSAHAKTAALRKHMLILALGGDNE